jgi:hypothetical protein
MQTEIDTLYKELQKLIDDLKDKEKPSNDDYSNTLNARFAKDVPVSSSTGDSLVVSETCMLNAYDAKVAYDALFIEKQKKEAFKKWLNE